MSNDIFNDPNAYLSELQRIEREQELAKLRTLSLEFAGVLDYFPKLREELEAFHHADGIAFDGLADRLRSNLKQAADLQFELEHLPADVRNAAEMQAFVQSLKAGVTSQTVAAFAAKFQPLCTAVRQQLERSRTKRFMLFKWLGLAGGVLALVLIGAVYFSKPKPTNDALAMGITAYQQGDFALALQKLRPLAEQNDGIAQVYLANMYEDGKGVTENEVVASDWFKKAAPLLQADAAQGNAKAQWRLGWMYENGKGGLAKDDATAVSWYRKAAEQGDSRGQAYLGAMYEQGKGGLAKDEATAVSWYRKSAEQGGSRGQALLGLAYEYGKGGLAKDEATAVSWYRKSAEQGDPRGQANLGEMYENGKGGLAKDEATAVSRYRKSAEQGDSLGQALLGLAYEYGKGGLAKDEATAVSWYRKSAEQGYTFAQEQLARLGKK